MLNGIVLVLGPVFDPKGGYGMTLVQQNCNMVVYIIKLSQTEVEDLKKIINKILLNLLGQHTFY